MLRRGEQFIVDGEYRTSAINPLLRGGPPSPSPAERALATKEVGVFMFAAATENAVLGIAPA